MKAPSSVPPRLSWRAVRWSLVRPLPLDGAGRERRVVELRLEREGRRVEAEAAPLPGLHPESVEDLLRVLEELALGWPAGPAGEDPERAAQRLGLSLPASLGWALEWAWRGLERELPVAVPPPSAGLVVEDPRGWRERVRAQPRQRCWKIKVGRGDPELEATAFRALARDFPGLEWRLDANRAFSLSQGLAFQAACAPACPRWIEEPLRDASELGEWLCRGGWPLALDESLRESPPPLVCDRAEAWVLKPQLLGLRTVERHFAAARALLHSAGRAPCCVVSACFESPLGLNALECLAASAPGLPAPGLGTRDWLGARLDDPPWREGGA